MNLSIYQFIFHHPLTIFERALWLELFHTMLQMKSVPLERCLELSILCLAFRPTPPLPSPPTRQISLAKALVLGHWLSPWARILWREGQQLQVTLSCLCQCGAHYLTSQIKGQGPSSLSGAASSVEPPFYESCLGRKTELPLLPKALGLPLGEYQIKTTTKPKIKKRINYYLQQVRNYQGSFPKQCLPEHQTCPLS